jgi:hypothetical protein
MHRISVWEGGGKYRDSWSMGVASEGLLGARLLLHARPASLPGAAATKRVHSCSYETRQQSSHITDVNCTPVNNSMQMNQCEAAEAAGDPDDSIP